MSDLNISIPHRLSEEEALQRIKQLLTRLKTEQQGRVSNIEEEWNGNTGSFRFSAQGFDLSGGIQVMPDEVQITGKLPFALSFFKGKISSLIEDKAKEVLSRG